MSPAQPRVLVFGIDSADWRIIRPLIDAGKLPTIARLVREGASGDLASTIHPHSPTAWSSFLTGMNPGGHGIFDFMQRKNGSYDFEVVSTKTRGGKAVWQILSERGIGCGVVNVPMTYPPEKVAGYFISGTFSSEPLGNFTWPRTLLDDIKRELGHGYKVDLSYRELAGPDGEPTDEVLARFLDRLIEIESERTAAEIYAIRRFSPRFVVHVYTATDRAQHTFWQYMDPERSDYDPSHPFRTAVERTYIDADAQLARLLDAMGSETTVMLMSDHGGGPLRRALLLNNWLAREGYLTVDQPPAFGKAALKRRVFFVVKTVARTLMPRAVRERLKEKYDVGGQTTIKYMQTALDWSRTRAFSEGTFGNIRLNVRGREPLGTVEPGTEYDALRAEIRRKLESLVDPGTGAPAVERTYAREELYRGAQIERAPDIIAALRDGYQMVGDVVAHQYGGKKRGDSVFVSGEGGKYKLSGVHTPIGIVAVHGPGIPSGATIHDAQITDLAPTLLALFGLTPPADMDGRVLTSIVPRHEETRAR